MIDKLLSVFIMVLVIGTIVILAYAIPQEYERSDRAKAIADQMGCEYIGSARDLNSIKFLDCNGEVKVIRVQVK